MRLSFCIILLLLLVAASDLVAASRTKRPTRKPTARPSTAKPTRKPTARPSTAKPTRKPTAHPSTRTPTAHPSTRKPTAIPTTAKPTQKPTLKRSAAPTVRATSVPTVVPTYLTVQPTSTPTTMLTSSPSLVPTSGQSPTPTTSAAPSTESTALLTYPPSLEPTIMPTSIPTVRPTASPTVSIAPTLAPSEQNSDTVTFQSNFTIDGVTQSFLDYNGSVALEETTAATLGFASSSCSTTGTSAPGGVERRLRSVRQLADASFTLVATVQTTVALSETSYSSVDALYRNVTATLMRQVENGVFTANLRVTALALGASDLYSADVRNVTVSSVPVVEGQDDESSIDGLSAGAVAGIVLGALFVIMVGAYCIHQRSVGPKQASARVKKSLRVSLLMGTLSGSTKPDEGQTV
jgi:hypothetical protein